MRKYVMAMDAGTTSNRCILFNKEGKIVSVAQKEFTQHFPQPGWVEHNAGEIWSTQLGVAVESYAKRFLWNQKTSRRLGLQIRERTTIVWDKHTGEPICPAIVWQCRRTAAMCDRLKEQGTYRAVSQKTGLIIDAYFSATKLQWILENVEGARERAENGELFIWNGGYMDYLEADKGQGACHRLF